MNCTVCDQQGTNSIGGIMLCRMHAAEVREEIDRLRADGKPVDAARIALALRKELDREYLLRGIPDDLWQKVKLHAAMHRTTVRELIISALKEIILKS